VEEDDITIANVRRILLPRQRSRGNLGDSSHNNLTRITCSGIDTHPTKSNSNSQKVNDFPAAIVAEVEGGSSASRHQEEEQITSKGAASHERSTNITITFPNEHITQHNSSTEDSLSRNIMGYNNTAHHNYQRSWTDSHQYAHSVHPVSEGNTSGSAPNIAGSAQAVFDDEKTMEHSAATAPTQFTLPSHIGGDEAHADEDDTTTIRSIDSITGAGILSMTEDDDFEPHDTVRTITGGHSTLLAPLQATGTAEATSSVCSVSTAPSTDEASSLGGMGDWANYPNDSASRLLQQQHYQQQHHRRVPSWEVSPIPHNQFAAQSGGRGSPAAINLPPSFSPAAWSSLGQPQQVASFRQEQQQQQGFLHMGRLNVNTSQWNHQHHTPPRYGGVSDPSLPFLPTSVARGGQDSPRAMYHRQNNSGNYPYPVQQQRKPYSQPPLPPSATNTPPRVSSERGGRGHNRVLSSGQSPHRSQQQSQQGSISGGGNARSSSEILKTLLRKKACLYEPDTSRAVALVTWLVGRELALEYGFFSRQQLQAGVHACVSNKIDSGVITRTKVNRCMQIILNSCFHYIIPRPDGTEENGEAFRGVFADEMKDDTFLLSVLPSPWNDIMVDRNKILAACEEEFDHKSPKKWTFETPQSSPRLGSVADKGSPSRESIDGDSDAKRAVLLCFNENVRRAEDVFRCHNEFIRDTAHACHLQLSSNEWRLFFGREAASAPYLWGNVGIPVPYLEGQGPQQTDALGVLTHEEVGVLRSSWCSKRYDHDHELCGFAHCEINGGWLRRNPYIHNYKDEMCPFVTTAPVNVRSVSRNVIVINECPHGVNCSFAHSLEEIMYHPRRYKQRSCSYMGRAGGCPLGDVCPGFHPADAYRFPKKSDSRSPRHSRQAQQHSGSGGKGASASAASSPSGSPILYGSPAPVSSYERHLLLPGLQSLFRRNCRVMLADLRAGSTCSYSYFGDDDGINPSGKTIQSTKSQSKAIGPPHELRI
jgi:hypothetical protein